MLPFGIGFSEIVVIGIVLLLVVGPHKLPDLAKSAGKGLRVVRRAANELRNAMDVEEVKAVRRELTRPIHDWKQDDEPEDMELGPDGVLRPVRNPPAPGASAAGLHPPPVSPAAPATAHTVRLDKPSAEGTPAGAPSAAGPVAHAEAAPGHHGADDDEDDPDAAAPPASVARHDPFFARLKDEVARATAAAESAGPEAALRTTAGAADGDPGEGPSVAERNAPVPRAPAAEVAGPALDPAKDHAPGLAQGPTKDHAKDEDGPDRSA